MVPSQYSQYWVFRFPSRGIARRSEKGLGMLPAFDLLLFTDDLSQTGGGSWLTALQDMWEPKRRRQSCGTRSRRQFEFGNPYLAVACYSTISTSVTGQPITPIYPWFSVRILGFRLFLQCGTEKTTCHRLIWRLPGGRRCWSKNLVWW